MRPFFVVCRKLRRSVRFRLTASYFLQEQKVTKNQRAAPFGERFFSTPFLLIAYKRNGVEPPKKIRQRGASKSFSFSPPTGEYPFGKTLPFYFRCRCSGADLRGLRPIALPHPQASLQSRRRSLARQTLTTTNGAAAIISGFMYPVTPRR